MIQILKNGVVVMESSNLRAIKRYAKEKSFVARVEVSHHATSGGYPVKFTFHDGATCDMHWQSDTLAEMWITGHRTWGDFRRETHFERGVAYKVTYHYV
jgi:hypothetical protein